MWSLYSMWRDCQRHLSIIYVIFAGSSIAVQPNNCPPHSHCFSKYKIGCGSYCFSPPPLPPQCICVLYCILFYTIFHHQNQRWDFVICKYNDDEDHQWRRSHRLLAGPSLLRRHPRLLQPPLHHLVHHRMLPQGLRARTKGLNNSAIGEISKAG